MLKVFEPIITKQDISQVLKSLKKVDISGSFNKTIKKFENNFSKFIGINHAQVFLHYNEKNGKFNELYDGRPFLGLPKFIK